MNKKINHISIIMDGNGRWAVERGLARSLGHRAGIKSVQTIIDAALVRQIDTLTLFAFSSENWNRPNDEITILMSLFNESITKYMHELNKNNIKVEFIGDIERFNSALREKINKLISLTQNNTGLNLNFAVNYGGKWDIANAVNSLIREKGHDINNPITEKDIDDYLTLSNNPPDLLIRTGGDHRLSNFMLWQHAYTELYFTDCLWPNFNEVEFDKAIKYFLNTTRKFGGLVNIDDYKSNV
jgi:undecaprenyl diphosphate synthase|tara:strand:+ start:506 stop:1228 length:723 start_codon:yes stop_codon:yes gene_type:complete